MARAVLTVLLSALLGLPSGPAAAAEPATDFVFTGSGWGHGVGLSQYGAYGLALDGETHQSILGHYYRGTAVVPVASTSAAGLAARGLWVGLVQAVEEARVLATGTDVPCAVVGSSTSCPSIPAGTSFGVEAVDGDRCQIRLGGAPVWQGPCELSFDLQAGAAEFGGALLTTGRLHVRSAPSGAGLHVVHEVGLERYLLGLAEVPASWPAEALKSQVVAARSFAVAQASARPAVGAAFPSAVKESCWCQLTDDTRSQVYRGDGGADPRWATAVSATSGSVVTYDGRVIRAFYSSSSGGRTENIEDVWGGPPVPYLVSVDDSSAHRSEVANSRTEWIHVRGATEVGQAVGLVSVSTIALTTRGSGAVDQATLDGTDANGETRTVVIDGQRLRFLLGLPSVWFTVEVARSRPGAY